MVCSPLTYKKNNSKDCDKGHDINNSSNNNNNYGDSNIIIIIIIIIIFRTRLNVNLVQRRYKKSKKKTFVLQDNKHEHFQFLICFKKPVC